jgi:5-methylcytosine-specific restriction endonuclease McrA
VVNLSRSEADVGSVARRKRCSKCGRRRAASRYYVKDKRTGRRFSWCKDCHCRITVANYYANHEEKKKKFRETMRVKYWSDPEKYRAKRKRDYRANLQTERERSRLYDAKRREQRKAYRERMKDHRKAYNAAWKKANKDKVNLQNHRRRVNLEVGGGHYTPQQWERLKRKYGHRCLCCREKDVALTVDHVRPVSRGGSNDIGNIQPLCFDCNNSKGTKTVDYRPKRV